MEPQEQQRDEEVAEKAGEQSAVDVPPTQLAKQYEVAQALNAKILAGNLVVSAQSNLRAAMLKEAAGDKVKALAVVEKLIDLAAKADVLGDKAMVRAEVVVTHAS